jgi:hypothetical protein
MTTILDLVIPLQNSSGGIAELLGGLIGLIVQLGLIIVIVAGFWKTFEKADEPGWAAIIPIYNTYVLIKVSGNAWWWLILLFIPVINLIALLKIAIDVAGKFGKGVLFGLGLGILPFIFYPLLGFGDARYQDSTQFG